MKNILKRYKHYFYKLYENVKTAEYTFMITAAIVVGILGGLGSIAVKMLIHYFEGLFFDSTSHHILDAIRNTSWYWLIIMPAIGGLIIGPIIYLFAREAKGHGVPEVMEAVVKRGGIIRPRIVFVKAIASSICIASGGSTGREGPIVQIGSSIGSAIGQLLRLPSNKIKTLVACGGAAGIAATFNAPIAGAIFAVEIILGEFGVAHFSPIVISSVVATVVSNQLSGGDFPTFLVPTDYRLQGLEELIPYIILGFLTALISVLYIRTLYKFEDIFDSFKLPEYVKPAIGGLLIGVIAIGFPQILGTGHNAINEALSYIQNIDYSAAETNIIDLFNNFSWSFYLMLALAFLKIIATSLTLGSGGSGGIFAPSLFIGAMLGGGFGIIFVKLMPSLVSSTYAFPIISMLVSMGAVVSATTHAPITAILIIFELTSYNYHIILPLMVTSIISTLVAQRLNKESIYTLKLIRKGVNIQAGQEINILKSIKASEVMSVYGAALIPSKMNLNEIMDIVIHSKYTYFVVIDNNKNIIGAFSLNSFKNVIADFEELKNVIIAQDILEKDIIYVKADDSLDYVLNKFGETNTEELPVMSDDTKEVIGAIWKSEVIKAYNRELLKAEMTSGIVDRISSIKRFESLEVIDGYSMIELPVPKSFVGKTILDINVRVKYNVTIILIKTSSLKNDKTIERRIFPFGDYIFKEDDWVIFFGEDTKINKIKNI